MLGLERDGDIAMRRHENYISAYRLNVYPKNLGFIFSRTCIRDAITRPAGIHPSLEQRQVSIPSESLYLLFTSTHETTTR